MELIKIRDDILLTKETILGFIEKVETIKNDDENTQVISKIENQTDIISKRISKMNSIANKIITQISVETEIANLKRKTMRDFMEISKLSYVLMKTIECAAAKREYIEGTSMNNKEKELVLILDDIYVIANRMARTIIRTDNEKFAEMDRDKSWNALIDTMTSQLEKISYCEKLKKEKEDHKEDMANARISENKESKRKRMIAEFKAAGLDPLTDLDAWETTECDSQEKNKRS